MTDSLSIYFSNTAIFQLDGYRWSATAQDPNKPSSTVKGATLLESTAVCTVLRKGVNPALLTTN
jgi:hypothetical protein